MTRRVDAGSEEEVVELLRSCSQDGTGVIPTSSSREQFRIPGEEEHLTVGLNNMSRILACEADDLTISVEPGVRLVEVQNLAAELGQRLTVDATDDDDTTLGALVATAKSSFCSSTFGGMAHQVLGIRAVSGDGRILAGGGRVVKNVTGYDFVRLLCGSAGTLGLITEITLRLRPLPVGSRTFVVEAPDFARAFHDAALVRGLPHQVTAVALVAGHALKQDRDAPLLMVRVEGSPGALKDFERVILQLGHGTYTLDENEATILWRQAMSAGRHHPFALTLVMPPSQAEDATTALLSRLDGQSWGMVLDTRQARLTLTLDSEEDPDEILKRLQIGDVEQHYQAAAALFHDPLDVERRWMRFSPPDDLTRAIADRIKIAFDPAGILMPMRPVAGTF